MSVLYCHCAYSQVVPERTRIEVLEALCASGIPFETTADLCELSARRAPALKRIAEAGNVTIIACYRRAVRALFAAAGAALPEDNVKILNMRTHTPEQIIPALPAGVKNAESTEAARRDIQVSGTGQWIPWFPVIDRDRCVDCRQCLNFCLFGVYDVSDDGKVAVANPANCKTNCPACARTCPSAAIIFPKYSSAPINGAEIEDGAGPSETTKVDVRELLRADVVEVLRRRGEQAGQGGKPAEDL